MPIRTTRPLGRVISMHVSIDDADPTASIVAWAPELR
jgi:hypothetical protein